jgi:tetratricopeptide (TPR) repeat protein
MEDDARAIALYALGRLAWVEDDRALERSAFTECLELARRIGDTQLDTLARLELGWTAFAEGAFDEARDLAVTGAEAAALSGDRHLRQKALQLRGVLTEQEGDLDLAGRLHRESLALARSIGNHRGVAGQLGNLGWIELQREEYDVAESYFVEALDVISPSDLENRAYMHGNLGMIALSRGDGARADEELRLCLEICRDLGMLRIAAEALTALAARAATAGDTQRAFALWDASDGLHETAGSMPTVVEERLRSSFLEPLGVAGRPRGAAARRARHMTLAAAIAYALTTAAESEAPGLPTSATTTIS